MDSTPGLSMPPRGQHVLVLAPFAQDAVALGELLAREGIDSIACATPGELFERIDADALMVLVTEEGLVQSPVGLVADSMRRQPSWSHIPILALAGRAGLPSEGSRLDTLAKLGNVTLIERPVSRESLMMAVNAALRTRRLQYQVRDQMEEMARHARELEQRVEQRTAALARETDERRRIEVALAEARRLESLGRLTGGIAHDFNNMLHVISGNAEMLGLLTRDSGDRRIGRALDAIRRASANGASLTSQLLAYARRQPLRNTGVDLRAHLEGLTELLVHSLGTRIAFRLTADPSLWPVSIDLAQFDSALMNLVLNARDATQGGGEVSLSLRNVRLPDPAYPEAGSLRGDFVEVALADQGEGMSPDVMSRAFEPFFTTKPLGKGTGLGLSQVHGFASQCGGQALIRGGSSGITVIMLLPRAGEAAVVAPAAEIADEPAPAGLHGVRVLCVEDDPEVGEVAAAMLGSLGVEVTLVASADRAAELELDRFDVVLSDVMMPGQLDGIGLARHVQQRRPGLPVILASGYVVKPERLHGMPVGYLQKPYAKDEMAAALRLALDRRAVSNEAGGARPDADLASSP